MIRVGLDTMGGDFAPVAWDAQAAVLELEASEDVSWSGIVKDVDGNEVIGASLSPSNGVGAASVNVILPYSTDIFDVTHKFNISATRAGETVFFKEYELGTTNRTLVSCEMDLEKGDIVKIEYSNGSSNAKLLCGKTYPISWTKKQ